MPTENYNSLRIFFPAISFSSVLVKHQKTTTTSITGKKIGILVFYLRCQRMEKLHATKTIVPNVVNLHFALRLDCGAAVAAVAAGCSLLLLVRYFLSKSTHMCVFFHCFSTLDAFNLMFFFSLSLFFSVLISPILVFKKPSGPTEYETITEKKTRKSFSRVEKRKQKKREKEYCV